MQVIRRRSYIAVADIIKSRLLNIFSEPGRAVSATPSIPASPAKAPSALGMSNARKSSVRMDPNFDRSELRALANRVKFPGISLRLPRARDRVGDDPPFVLNTRDRQAQLVAKQSAPRNRNHLSA
jgi:hypothetical protein